MLTAVGLQDGQVFVGGSTGRIARDGLRKGVHCGLHLTLQRQCAAETQKSSGVVRFEIQRPAEQTGGALSELAQSRSLSRESCSVGDIDDNDMGRPN